ncbi:hypothetical protein P3X46_010906 [Hevea brasiliensis]|uniref:Uncharacterized protein n=3 Tax=Hevea brasiliensis TaxID=3981 RepID=A0ABQ9MHZ2_HEVBR|nr:hypothetical protein P3X46_010906 [Hevea brasiliensis]
MLGVFCRKLGLNHRSITLLDSKTQLGQGVFPFDALFITRRFSSNLPLKSNNDSFTISYLINSCGLSPESAKSVSKELHFKSPNKPDSILSFLRDLGLTDTQISKVVRRRPRLLLRDLNKRVLPNLGFLRSLGVSSNDLPKMISGNPDFLFRSLERHLIPSYNILKSLLLSDEKVFKTLIRLSPIDLSSVKKNFTLNLLVLRELGMPESTISLFVTSSPKRMCQNVDKFSRNVKEIIGMGFNPVKSVFAFALGVKSQMSPITWKGKIEVFRTWGLLEDEILLAFRKYPLFMILSEKTIMKKMDFLVNEMGCQPAVLARTPAVLTYSLEKRIVPRCSVIKVLLLKGLIKETISLLSFLPRPDKSFLESFVIKHEEQVPQLMDVFKGKTDLAEVCFGFGEKCSAPRAQRAAN